MSNRKSSSLLHRDVKQVGRISDQTTRLTIAGVSLVVVLAVAVPWSVEYLRLVGEVSEMNSLYSQLSETQTRKEKIETIESTLKNNLQHASSHSIRPDNINQIRDQLVVIVRDSGASLRRLEIGENIVRPWGAVHDDPHQDTSPDFGQESHFVLHKHMVQLQADGTLQAIQKILDKVQKTSWLLNTKTVTLSPNSVADSPVILEAQWILFGLEEAPEEELDEFEEFDESFEGEEFAGVIFNQSNELNGRF